MGPSRSDVGKAQRAELLQAAAGNLVEPLRQFVDVGGAVDEVRGHERQTLLHACVAHGSLDALSFLLRCPRMSKLVNACDQAKRTPLHLASAYGYDSCVQRLLDARAGLDVQDEQGCTALYLAVKFEWVTATRMLLEAGCDPLMEDWKGINVVDLASAAKAQEFSSMLSSFGGRRQSKLLELRKCLLPRWRQTGHSRRADAYTASTPGLDEGAVASPAKKVAESRPLPPPIRPDVARGSTSARRQDSVRDQGIPVPPPPPPLPRGAAVSSTGPAGGRSCDAGSQRSPSNPLANIIAEAAREHLRRSNEGAEISEVLGPQAALVGEPGMDIEWHGLEPVPVARHHRHAAADAVGASVEARPPLAPVVAGQAGPTGEVAAVLRPWHGARASEREAFGSPCGPPRAALCRSPASEVPSEFAIFRLHTFFDRQVKRLEFEVTWKDDGQPTVGAVKPGGAADRRCMVQGDRLVEVSGVYTSGKGRNELLPLLTDRPLLLKVDREAPLIDPNEPHTALNLVISCPESHGLEINWLGQMPVATGVMPHSAAWTAGLLEGDGIFKVNGCDATGADLDDLLSALEERPLTLTVWRRPLGLDLQEPWYVLAQRGPPLAKGSPVGRLGDRRSIHHCGGA